MGKIKVTVGKDKKTGKDVMQIQRPYDERKRREEEMFKKYPKIFRQKELPMSQTAMCWGLEIGPGWYPLIDCLCMAIQQYIDYHQLPQVEAIQVKEKFGGLRFYTDQADDYVRNIINFAEHMSYFICEDCGTTNGATQNDHGWITTLCPECRKKDFETKKKNLQGIDLNEDPKKD